MSNPKTVEEYMTSLTREQCEAVIKLINDEKQRNIDAADDAYNLFWDNIIHSFGYATYVIDPAKERKKYGDHIIGDDWEKIEDVYIWFEALNRGVKWRGIPGYVYEKPDGTFVAPFRGSLVSVIKDGKNEFREGYIEL